MEGLVMPQIGDAITYVGDGNDGTTEGAQYSGLLTNVNSPGGWGVCDINIDLAGTPTDILGVQRSDAAPLNGTWSRVV
jgi:hypothetical protein